VNIAFEAC